MKHLILVLSAALVFAACGDTSKKDGTQATASEQAQKTVAQPVKEEPFLFRDMPWGASREEIVAKEGNDFVDLDVNNTNMLMYQKISVAGKTVDVGYIYSYIYYQTVH
jgi:hypothetical protein